MRFERKIRAGWIRGLAFCLLPLLGSAAELRAAVTLEISTDAAGEDTLVVSGASPGGQVAFIGVGREERLAVTSAVQGCDLVTAGPDGVASWPLGRSVPDLSRWLAIDLASGTSVRLLQPASLGFTSVAGFPTLPLSHGGAIFRLPAPGAATVLVARPGVGAWCAAISDGGTRDSDLAEDGGADVGVDDLVAVAGTSGVPVQLATGDWLVFGDSDAVLLTQIQISATHLLNNLVEP